MTIGRLGVGVIGLGVGQQHARTFAQHGDCYVAALCDVNPDKLEQVGREIPGAKRYRESAGLIDDPDVQIVSVASNDDHHAVQVVRSLQRGKHVFAEKPLCLNRAEFDEIVAAWRVSGGARLSTNTLLRRSPRFRWLKNAINAGQLGTVFCVEADYVYGRLHKLLSGWRGEIRNYSVILGGAIHLIDLVLWLSGQRPIEVCAYGSGLGTAETTFKGKDLVLALLRFDSGLIAKIGANFASVYPHFHRLAAYGTKGTFENMPAAVSSSARLWESRDGGLPPREIDEPYPAVGKGDLIPSFVEAVLGRGVPEVPESDVFAAIAVALAIEDALVVGRPVAVEYAQP